ncbi:hypothetical protein JOM56_003830 [Amanita muscaria]|uniref:37S ribosomal protein mrp10, mitochondrial n=1 Tax=Amanita muscaria (strain Koide BX008) TaxID=946122 RepID=A0A0C2XGT2_AMAMK|nr:hypothetical protein M378DRAFT_71736 [Amanita muscaria Koide BX008]
MAIHIKKLKVRPRKNAANNICGSQLATLLACWAASGDLHSNTKSCADATAALFTCMRTTPMSKGFQKPAINYHLGRLGKTIQ